MEDKKGLRGHLRNSIRRNTIPESAVQESLEQQGKEVVVVSEVEQEKQVLPDIQNYIVDQEKEEKQVQFEKKATFLLSTEILEMIDREAYWERYSVKEVVQQIFNEHFQNKNYDPIPANRKSNRRGPKPKK